MYWVQKLYFINLWYYSTIKFDLKKKFILESDIFSQFVWMSDRHVIKIMKLLFDPLIKLGNGFNFFSIV